MITIRDWFLIFFIAGFFLSSCDRNAKEPFTPYRDGATVLTVKGMYCSNCEGKITTALSKTKGVEWARAENELGEVAYTGAADKSEVISAITDAGFEVIE